LKECFTTHLGGKAGAGQQADEEVDEEDPRITKGVKIRLPSYTDRILYVLQPILLAICKSVVHMQSIVI